MNDLICESCGKSKNSLKRIPSKLIPGMFIIICSTCIQDNFEPRFIIILAYNQKVTDLVKKYILEHRYHGATIALGDVL